MQLVRQKGAHRELCAAAAETAGGARGLTRTVSGTQAKRFRYGHPAPARVVNRGRRALWRGVFVLGGIGEIGVCNGLRVLCEL